VTERIRRSYDVPMSPGAFFAALSSRAVVERRSDADGVGTRVVQHEADADRIRITIATEVPLEWLPGAVAARMGTAPTVTRTEEWTLGGDSAHTPLSFDFSGMPVSCSGDADLAPQGDTSRLDVDLLLRIEVPIFGALVERALSPRIVAALGAEAQFYRTL
jgi:hypothetical protein